MIGVIAKIDEQKRENQIPPLPAQAFNQVRRRFHELIDEPKYGNEENNDTAVEHTATHVADRNIQRISLPTPADVPGLRNGKQHECDDGYQHGRLRDAS